MGPIDLMLDLSRKKVSLIQEFIEERWREIISSFLIMDRTFPLTAFPESEKYQASLRRSLLFGGPCAFRLSRRSRLSKTTRSSDEALRSSSMKRSVHVSGVRPSTCSCTKYHLRTSLAYQSVDTFWTAPGSNSAHRQSY